MIERQTSLADLYRETILANAVQPCGHNRAIAATHQAERDNPLCGDRIKMLLKIEDQVVEDVAFEGEACAICLAAASLLCRHLPGQAVGFLQETLDGFHRAISDDQRDFSIEFLRPMLGVAAYPSRIQCATLPVEAAIAAASSNKT